MKPTDEEDGTVTATQGTEQHISDAPSDVDEKPLKQVPFEEYLIECEHGRGGLGRILRARDRLGRIVAVKELINPGYLAQRRFEREARLTARLQHPSIVPVYEAGRWPNGLPFYSMTMVNGKTLKDVIANCQSVDQRLALLPHVIAVGEAVAYAHSKRILHRDLKPSNVVIGGFGETIVIDWGLAKDLEAVEEARESGPYRGDEQGDVTRTGAVLGTPAYMAPEQATGLEVDERADIYSLGAILYHVLAGYPPYKGSTSAEVIAAVLAKPPLPLGVADDGIPTELSTIVERAISREPSSRYSSAYAMVADLKSFQAGQLVSAHRYSWSALLYRWVRKHRAVLSMSLVFLILLAVGASAAIGRIVHSARAAQRASVIAEAERAKAESSRLSAEAQAREATLSNARAQLRVDPAVAVELLSKVQVDDPSWPEAQHIAADAWSMGVPELVASANQAIVGLDVSDDMSVVGTAGVGDGVVAISATTGRKLFADRQTRLRSPIAVSADGRLLAYLGRDSFLRLADTTSGKVRSLPGKIDCFALDPHGGYAVVGQRTAGVSVISLENESRVSTILSRRWPSSEECSVSISRGGRSGIVRLGGSSWVFERAGEQWQAEALPTGFATTPDEQGSFLVLAEANRYYECRATRCSSPRVMLGDLKSTSALQAAPRGGLLAIATSTEVLIYRAGVLEWQESVAGHPTSVSVSEDGLKFVAGCDDGVIRYYERSAGLVAELRGHSDRVVIVRCNSSCGAVVSAGLDGEMRVWRPDAMATGRLLLSSEANFVKVVAAQDSIYLVDGKGEVSQIETKSMRVLSRLSGIPQPVDMALSRDGQRLAIAGGAGSVWVVDQGLHKMRSIDVGTSVVGIDFSRLGTLLVLCSDGSIRRVTVDSGQMAVVDGVPATATTMAVSHDSELVAVGNVAGDVSLISLDANTALWNHHLHDQGRVYAIAFVPGMREYVVAAHGSGAAILYGPEERDAQIIHKFDTPAVRVAVRDDAMFAAASSDGDVFVSKLGALEGRVLDGHHGLVNELTFMRDGHLVSSSFDRTTRLWDLESESVSVLRGHQAGVSSTAVSPDAIYLIAADFDGIARITSLGRVSPPDSSEKDVWFRTVVPRRLVDRSWHYVQQDAARSDGP